MSKEKWELDTYKGCPEDFVIRHVSGIGSCRAATPTYYYLKSTRKLYTTTKHNNLHNINEKTPLICCGCRRPLPPYLVIQKYLLNG